ncbi:MAG: histidine phosphatase family protein [Pseudomonadota bacterium]
MKSLHLLRHAKSRRDDPKLEDHDRPLSPRGMEDMMAVAEHCANTGIHPELILCSSALRTRATMALLIPYLPPGAAHPGRAGPVSRSGQRSVRPESARSPTRSRRFW